jgi:hypothetical protein
LALKSIEKFVGDAWKVCLCSPRFRPPTHLATNRLTWLHRPSLSVSLRSSHPFPHSPLRPLLPFPPSFYASKPFTTDPFTTAPTVTHQVTQDRERHACPVGFQAHTILVHDVLHGRVQGPGRGNLSPKRVYQVSLDHGAQARVSSALLSSRTWQPDQRQTRPFITPYNKATSLPRSASPPGTWSTSSSTRPGTLKRWSYLLISLPTHASGRVQLGEPGGNRQPARPARHPMRRPARRPQQALPYGSHGNSQHTSARSTRTPGKRCLPR